MAHVISSECISCGACEATCPVEAISQGDDQFVIDANKCTDCGACVDSCPVDAISAGQNASICDPEATILVAFFVPNTLPKQHSTLKNPETR